MREEKILLSNSLNKYLLRAHYMPGTILGLGDTTKNNTKSLPVGNESFY